MYHGTCKRKCRLEAKVSESAKFSMDLRKTSEEAGNYARQGKREWRCTLQKREKGGKWLHVKTEIIQTKSLNSPKQDHMHILITVVILYTPQPPPYMFFSSLLLTPSNMATLSVVLWIYNVGEVMLHWYQIIVSNQPNYTGCTTDYLQEW